MRGVSGEGELGASVPPVWQMRRQLRQDALLPETSQQTRPQVELETGTRQVSRLFPSIPLVLPGHRESYGALSLPLYFSVPSPTSFQGLTMWPRVAFNLQRPSCLILSSVGIPGVSP